MASMIEELAIDGDLDGFLFIFPDFVEGLAKFDAQVMPLLRKRGLRRLRPRLCARGDARSRHCPIACADVTEWHRILALHCKPPRHAGIDLTG